MVDNKIEQILEKLPIGIIKLKTLTGSNNEICDLKIEKANDNFEKIANIKNKQIINKGIKEVFPDDGNLLFDWISILNEVAITSETRVINQYFDIFDKQLNIYISNYNKDEFYIFFEDQTEKKQVKKFILERDKEIEYLQIEIRKKSVIDNLTSVYNHQFIIDSIKSEIENYKELENNFTTVILDIDRFKHINDNYGRKEADRILIEVANAIANSIRKIDLVGRHGCDEFAIVLTSVEIDIAKIIVERIKNDINKFVKGFDDFKITISGAVLEYNGQNLEQYIKDIEEKLNKAKSFGGNVIMV